MKLLVIADDFTGALDSGVQFSSRNIKVQIIVHSIDSLSEIPADAEVLVVDAETRHLPASEAYGCVYQIAKAALASDFTHIYKKTDSALRGNVGAELTAVLEAAGAAKMPFLPAFPKLNRTTRGGIQYVDGTPVAESVFGRDPFEPVTNSRVPEIIHQGSSQPVVLHPLGADLAMDRPGIHVYDAEAQENLKQIGAALGPDGIRISAGCAGFASEIADILFPHSKQIGHRVAPGKSQMLFVACGSVNDVTIRQMEEAEKAGFVHIHLSAEQKLDPLWPGSDAMHQAVQQWLPIASKRNFILDVNDPPGGQDTPQYAAAHKLTKGQMRERISHNLGAAVESLLDNGLNNLLLCTGGDTLLALMKQVRTNTLTPVGELIPGIVMTNFSYAGQNYNMITKSGGFGTPDLFVQIAKIVGG